MVPAQNKSMTVINIYFHIVVTTVLHWVVKLSYEAIIALATSHIFFSYDSLSVY